MSFPDFLHELYHFFIFHYNEKWLISECCFPYFYLNYSMLMLVTTIEMQQNGMIRLAIMTKCVDRIKWFLCANWQNRLFLMNQSITRIIQIKLYIIHKYIYVPQNECKMKKMKYNTHNLSYSNYVWYTNFRNEHVNEDILQ